MKYMSTNYIPVKKLFRALFRKLILFIIHIGKVIKSSNFKSRGFLIATILILLIGGSLYFYLANSIYNKYTLVSMNSYDLSKSKYEISILKDHKITGNICGGVQGSFADIGDKLTGNLSVNESSCDQIALSVQYAFMYGLQSGLRYSLENDTLTLKDEARNNIFTLKKIVK